MGVWEEGLGVAIPLDLPQGHLTVPGKIAILSDIILTFQMERNIDLLGGDSDSEC